MIEVKNVTKRYGEKLAVDNLSFTVHDGEVLGFLGPNGAGKSTTMNIITGYLSATEGSVTVDGVDAVSGATKTTEGYRNAVKDALHAFATLQTSEQKGGTNV